MKHIALILILSVLSQPSYSQRTHSTRTLGWDLSYASVLDRNKIGRGEWIRKWLGPAYQSPVKALIRDWKGGPILSSILIEAPAPHAGERFTMWLVRTSDNAYRWEFAEGRPPYNVQQPIKPQLYDDLFATLSSWRQGEPTKPENTPTGGVPGYVGFLSLYDRSSSRQMLLSGEDFQICEMKECESPKPGRLSQALETLRQK